MPLVNNLNVEKRKKKTPHYHCVSNLSSRRLFDLTLARETERRILSKGI